MFTKQHYETLVVIIAESRDLKEFTEKLIQYFKKDNPKFNELKFRFALC
jgi:hypothetical protein